MVDTKSAPRRYVPPGFFMAHVLNPVLKFIGSPALTVRGRRTGQALTTPLAPFTYKGARYLIASGGETHWVRNLRAAGIGQLRTGKARQDFRSVELEGAERDQVVSAFRDFIGLRSRIYFAALPNLADHPVFRVDPVSDHGCPSRMMKLAAVQVASPAGPVEANLAPRDLVRREGRRQRLERH